MVKSLSSLVYIKARFTRYTLSVKRDGCIAIGLYIVADRYKAGAGFSNDVWSVSTDDEVTKENHQICYANLHNRSSPIRTASNMQNLQ